MSAIPDGTPRCATCAHWTQDAEYLEGDCAALYATMTAVGQPRAVLLPADDRYPPRVMTLPGFGCILYIPSGEVSS